jgi:hypothetical protein
MDRGQSIIAAYVALFALSIVYNWLVAWLEKNALLDGLKAILVVFGVAYTLLVVSPIIGSEHALIVAGAFLFSLLPVTFGDIKRHLEARLDELKFWRSLTRKDR